MMTELKKEQTDVQDWTLSDTREITEQDIIALRDVDDLDAADILDARARALERATKRSFVELGIICLEMEDRKLWSKLTDPSTGVYFHSIDAWMSSSLNVSRSNAYAAKSALQKLKAVPTADLQEMPRCNVVQLAALSTAVQKDPEILQLAKESSEKQFVEAINKKYPEQHVEPRRSIVATPVESQRKKIDEAITVAMWRYELTSREEALELLAEYFLGGGSEIEGMESVDNRTAYAQAIGKDGKAHA